MRTVQIPAWIWRSIHNRYNYQFAYFNIASRLDEICLYYGHLTWQELQIQWVISLGEVKFRDFKAIRHGYWSADIDIINSSETWRMRMNISTNCKPTLLIATGMSCMLHLDNPAFVMSSVEVGSFLQLPLRFQMSRNTANSNEMMSFIHIYMESIWSLSFLLQIIFKALYTC